MSNISYNEIIDDLIKAHNEYRNNLVFTKVSPLKKNNKLMIFAQNWADHMGNTERMYHSKMIDILRLGFMNVGENIAMGHKQVDSVMKNWVASYGHRKNMSSKSYTDIGCGYSISKNKVPYWCVCFGTPSPEKK
jgi:uncharacterized protein YkwD